MSDVAKQAPSILEDLRQSKPFRSRSQEAYLALLRTADDSKRHVSHVLEAVGVTLQQYNVLRILRGAGEGGLPTLSVAERMIERTPGVTRERCTQDRRRVWCKITDAGLALLTSLDRPIDTVDDAMTQALEEEEILELSGYLDRLRVHLNADCD